MLYKVQEESLRVKSKMGDESAVKKLRAEAVSRYGPSHPDRDEVTPIALPIMILGNKYEVFREEDTVKRKGIIQAIRYIAHMYGATLLFTSTKDKNLATQVCPNSIPSSLLMSNSCVTMYSSEQS
jgi:dynein light intermediate chain 2